MSGVYLLDTDTCAFVLRRSSPPLLERIQSVPLAQQAIPVVTCADLLYGVQVSSGRKANQEAVDAVTNNTKDFGRVKGLEVENWMN